jgi:hypothetical protein
MAEENLLSQAKSSVTPQTATVKKSRLSKIPTEVLLSPGGIILIFFALVLELLDLIPIPFLDQIWELPFELIFIFLLIIIAKVPIKSCLLPFIIERVPAINDILPTWLLRLFV